MNHNPLTDLKRELKTQKEWNDQYSGNDNEAIPSAYTLVDMENRKKQRIEDIEKE